VSLPGSALPGSARLGSAPSVSQLVDALRELGVALGDVVMVHASLRAVGPVVGGAAGVVAALDASVGPTGTLLMTLGDGGPADQLFDAWSSPADPDNGVLAEVFRTSPGTVVSDHPEGRFGARGRLADAFVRGVPWDHYYGPGSPLERFVRADGRVLRLGADRNTVTLIHYAEYLAEVPNKRTERRMRLVRGPAGPVVRVVHCLDDSNGIVEFDGPDYFEVILDAYLATTGNGARVGVVGSAKSELLDGAALVAFAVEWMEQRFSARRPDSVGGSTSR
jgi:aminoglycoside N3'-acetyltransferase